MPLKTALELQHADMDDDAPEFWGQWKEAILALAKAHQKGINK